MSRRNITIVAFFAAVIMAVIGAHYCNHKVVPLIRVALWFPLPFLLHASGILGLCLGLVQFLLLAGIFARAIRRWATLWVLATFLIAYGLYAAIVFATFGPWR